MVYISVLYTDLTFKSEPLDNIDNLPKDNVLFIRTYTDLREGKDANISQIQEHDSYALLRMKKDNDDWHMLIGWDEDDCIWRRECRECIHRLPVDMPIGTMHVIFRGGSISRKDWKKAITIIDKEM